MALATDLAYMNWLYGEELTRQQNIAVARDYYAGDQSVPLTDRQTAYLGFKRGGRFAANYCATVINSVVERLKVQGFESPNDDAAEWAWQAWQANRMDATQVDVHEAAIRDGESFVMVDWDTANVRPRFTFHPRYVDAQAGGDGYGCKAFYPNGDYRLPMEYASKRWTETVTVDERRVTRTRMTVYYPDRVEKYVLGGTTEATWQPYPDEDNRWPLPWVTDQGQPLGIPVIHFKSPGLQSELWNAIPLQDAVNKSLIDLLAAQDTAGFRLFFARGFYATSDGNAPESDGSNYLTLAPGQIVGTLATDADFGPIDPADIAPMIETFLTCVATLAQVTDTPQGRFQLTRQVQSEGSQKQAELPLLAKVALRQVVFGNAWEDCLSIARKLANLYTGANLDEEAQISTQWVPAEVRDERQFIESLALKREKLSVPLEQIWSEAGYSQEQIDAMLESQEMQARRAMMQIGMQAQQEEDAV